ncbi:MAG TPA: Gfo/Idh/MocA family oxidoreductase [Bryobacteraceae bacterium]|nr:Gfo/Idh/MocA family oxidoreductase [Bryobacteraceae bacterium]HOQ45095.1 Gfo/Idh/MocA family oxidoreductase [Bryobacteraceae bacterium]HPQ13692.1 Gfo/Idh/MocA family oxidoreductase [Bryobacteraceae bacterium]HPU71167.1 Gfo/Idh/MocA family oxidoreductase [Bryobacteraceae bacterium]
MQRRQFLGAVLGFPMIVPARALGRAGAVAPSDKIVMGMIGVGGMGSGHVRGFLQQPDVRVVAICDVRKEARDKARDMVDARYGDKGCATYNDFRELLARTDIDAVMIATPEHWHALIGIEAARRGKHMYYEKPIGVSVAEAKAIREAVKRYGVVFQLGTQQRSDRAYRHTCELILNGRIGELKTVMIGSAGGNRGPRIPEEPAQKPPEGFDYDMWLGPAPWVDYTPERVSRTWMMIHDYGLGCLSGAWGIHDVDIAQWVAGCDDTTPIETEATGLFYDDIRDVAYSWTAEHRYANGVRVIHMDLETAKKRAQQFHFGGMASVMFGTEGWIYVSRQGMRTHPERLMHEIIKPHEKKVIKSDNHRRNFLDAIRTRQQPISNIDAAAHGEMVCQQADIAMRLGRKLRWDPVKEEFVDDPEANRMLARSMRSPWRL